MAWKIGLVSVAIFAVLQGDAFSQQRYIVRPGPYYVPRPLPQPRMVPRYQFGYPAPQQRFIIPGQTAGATPYRILPNGRACLYGNPCY
jgi:hypothetical protein